MMTDAPKRRGRPPKKAPEDWVADKRFHVLPQPVPYFRIKAGAIQQAFAHPTGTQWRALPVVAPDAPDWEDA